MILRKTKVAHPRNLGPDFGRDVLLGLDDDIGTSLDALEIGGDVVADEA